MQKTLRNIGLFTSLTITLLPAAAGSLSHQAYAKEPQPASPPVPSFADLAEELLPSVVNVSTTQKVDVPEDFPEIPQFPEGSPYQDFFDEFMQKRGRNLPMAPVTSLGSGFVVDAENGYIVTNNHVVSEAEEVRVTFHDDVTVPAEIIGRDEKTDIAVLKIDVKKDMKISATTYGDSDKMRVGDWILAIGNPFGLGGTVTTGIISARARDINSGPYDDFLQTDASINRGNSGGPMFNMNGDLIGINTAIFSPSGGSVGIGFAIPSNLAKPVINQIIKYGHTRRGWLGVRIQTVTDEIAESLGLEKAEGALVASVTEEGPAEKAGIESGDVILSINGQKITEMRMLPRIVAETDIGAMADVVYWRDGKTHTVKAEVGELEKAEEDGLIAKGPKSDGGGLEIAPVGLVLKKLTPETRSEFNLPPTISGVVVSEVKNLSEAAKKGISEGDVIIEINQQPVTEPEAIEEVIQKALKNNRKSILLLVNSNGDVQFIALRLDQEEPAPVPQGQE
ncbi:MAG: DegQ family serine endoprotease [Alphaproteobacteria bacterium]|nr:DegQ family serine endoprotease [Alphaproteobacteria bacterium]